MRAVAGGAQMILERLRRRGDIACFGALDDLEMFR
jgi:hypothetical protein